MLADGHPCYFLLAGLPALEDYIEQLHQLPDFPLPVLDLGLVETNFILEGPKFIPDSEFQVLLLVPQPFILMNKILLVPVGSELVLVEMGGGGACL